MILGLPSPRSLDPKALCLFISKQLGRRWRNISYWHNALRYWCRSIPVLPGCWNVPTTSGCLSSLDSGSCSNHRLSDRLPSPLEQGAHYQKGGFLRQVLVPVKVLWVQNRNETFIQHELPLEPKPTSRLATYRTLFKPKVAVSSTIQWQLGDHQWKKQQKVWFCYQVRWGWLLPVRSWRCPHMRMWYQDQYQWWGISISLLPWR